MTALSATLTIGAPLGHTAPATLVGHNLEVYQFTVGELMSNRLDNHRFLGPPQPATGIAPEWATSTNNYVGFACQLCAGDGVMGHDAQRIENINNQAQGAGILQPGRWVRAGETLEVVIWARTWGKPTRITVGVARSGPGTVPYASADITVAAASYRPYRVTLDMTHDDDDAVFFIWVAERGVIFIDQVWLQPAEGGLVRKDVRQALADFRIPDLRFPGGCVTTAYHWRYGTGEQHLRPALPDPVFKGVMRYDFGTDEYLALCRDLAIRPHFVVNIGSQVPGEAAEWAAYCAQWWRDQGLEPPVTVWQLGNEHYGSWERSYMTAEMFVEEVEAMVPGIREHYPNAIIMLLGQEQGTTPPWSTVRPPWRSVVLDRVGHLADLIAMQIYCICRTDLSGEEKHVKMLDEAAWLNRKVTDAVEDVQARGLDIGVGLSEWGFWTQGAHYQPRFNEPQDIQHGLFVATVLSHLIATAPVAQFSNYYHLLAGMGLFAVERDQVRRGLVADVFNLYRDVLPGQPRAIELDSPITIGDHPGIVASALDTEDGTHLILINRSMNASVDITLKGATAVRGHYRAGDHPHDTEGTSAELTIHNNSIHLPPLSVAQVACN